MEACPRQGNGMRLLLIWEDPGSPYVVAACSPPGGEGISIFLKAFLREELNTY